MFIHHTKSNVKRLLFLLFLPALFLTDAQAQRKVAGTRNLKWNNDIESKTGENERVKLLNFDGAVYDGSVSSLPYFTELVAYPYPGSEPIVTLKNVQYEPFTTTASVPLQLIGNEATVKGEVMIEKKQRVIGITVLPLRKNTTGGLERLVSFDIDIAAGNPSKLVVNSNAQAYAANSVLSSGSWFKMGVNVTGIHMITADVLRQLGMTPANVNPARMRVFGNGMGMMPFLNSTFRHDDLAENAIFVSD